MIRRQHINGIFMYKIVTSSSERILKRHPVECRENLTSYLKSFRSGYSGALKANIAIVDLRVKHSVLRVRVYSPVIKLAISEVL